MTKTYFSIALLCAVTLMMAASLLTLKSPTESSQMAATPSYTAQING